jgi:hypothetical protein
MPTVRNIANIKANLLHPALTSHFEVKIPIPGGGFGNFLKYNGVNLDQERLNLMCSEATLPGSNLATFEINDNFHGVTERHAYRRIYDDRIDLTFYVDADNYLPIRYFETWMKYIVDESRGKQPDKNAGSEDRDYFYRVRYPEGTNGYTSDGLTVTKFERTGNKNNSSYQGSTLEYKFIRAFPISINSMPVSYDSSSLLKCTVSMSYIRYVLMQGSNKAELQSDTRFPADPSGPNPLAPFPPGQGFSDPKVEAAFNRIENPLSSPGFVDVRLESATRAALGESASVSINDFGGIPGAPGSGP